MAFTKYGDGSYRFAFDSAEAAAIAAAVGLKPQEMQINSEPEFVAKAEDGGLVAAMAVSPDKDSFTMSGYIVDLALFKAGGTFTFDSKFFVVTGRQRGVNGKEYEKGQLSGEHHSLITAVIAAT